MNQVEALNIAINFLAVDGAVLDDDVVEEVIRVLKEIRFNVESREDSSPYG